MVKRRQYHAHLDESGQREYGAGTDRYYVVTGIISVRSAVARYEGEICGIKRLFFGDPYVEVKSNWLRRPQEAKKRYLDPYGLTKARLTEFTEALYEWFSKTKLRLIAGVVDKAQMQKDYEDPHHVSAVGYLLFLQRYQKFLGKRRGTGFVTCDRISGSSAAGNQWKRLLERQHRMLLRHGCPYTRLDFTRIEKPLAFVDSEDSGLVQLADLAAYNVFRQFKDYGSVWDNPGATSLPVYPFFDRMLPRFDQDPSGVFAGYGVAKMPSRAKNRWVA